MMSQADKSDLTPRTRRFLEVLLRHAKGMVEALEELLKT